MFAQPTGWPSMSAVRLSSTWVVNGTVRSASQRGTTRAGSVGPNREKLTGRSRNPISLAIAAVPNTRPDTRVIAPPMARPTASRRRRGSKALPKCRAAPRPLKRLVPARARSQG